MSVPLKYADRYIPVKYFLNSYRALSDGQIALRLLDEQLTRSTMLFSEWKINWIAACTLLRSSIDLFREDQRSCINQSLKDQIKVEWDLIKKNDVEHAIFWKFLRKERDSIIHNYEWSAYEVWMKDNDDQRPARLSLLDMKKADERSILLMRSGAYKGRDSIELLHESASWVECRIFNAIERAGFSPNEKRSIYSFTQQPPAPPSILSQVR